MKKAGFSEKQTYVRSLLRKPVPHSLTHLFILLNKLSSEFIVVLCHHFFCMISTQVVPISTDQTTRTQINILILMKIVPTSKFFFVSSGNSNK